MADDTSTDTSDTTATDPPATAQVEDKQPDDLGEAGKKALAAERAAKKAAEKQASEFAARLKEYEDRDKTEAQKLADRAEAAEKRAAALELAAMRSQAAMAAGLPADLVERLRGETPEALAEDAAALASLLRATKPAQVDQGVKGTGTSGVAQLSEADVKKLASEGKHAEIEKARVAGQLNDLLGIT